MLNDIRTAPWGASVAGLAGLLVFFVLALAIAFGSPTLAINAYLQLIHFGVLILTFVGAIHWGLAINAEGHNVAVPPWWYPVSTLPMALGWLTLALVSPTTKIILLMVGFFGTFMLDVSATARGHAPLWYKNFRKFLTFAVLIALVVALWAIRMPSEGRFSA